MRRRQRELKRCEARPRAEPCLRVPIRLIPIDRDADIVRERRAFAGFDQRLQAHQEGCPFGAAMVHERALLLPTLLLEKHRGLVAVLAEIEADLAADPFFRAFDDLPNDAFGWFKFKDLG